MTKRNFKLKVKYFLIWFFKFERLFIEISELISRIFNLQIQNRKSFQHFIHLKTLASPLMASMTLFKTMHSVEMQRFFHQSNFYVKSIWRILEPKNLPFHIFW